MVHVYLLLEIVFWVGPDQYQYLDPDLDQDIHQGPDQDQYPNLDLELDLVTAQER